MLKDPARVIWQMQMYSPDVLIDKSFLDEMAVLCDWKIVPDPEEAQRMVAAWNAKYPNGNRELMHARFPLAPQPMGELGGPRVEVPLVERATIADLVDPQDRPESSSPVASGSFTLSPVRQLLKARSKSFTAPERVLVESTPPPEVTTQESPTSPDPPIVENEVDEDIADAAF